jgi:ABC-type transport system involved in multi-copper enzyme maturation permease subunit
MTFSPIIIRELRVASRRSVTYRNRVIISGVVGALAIFILLFGSFSTVPSKIGSTLFQTMTWISLGFCLVDGVRKTADALSEEKRSGTLGLLFLTDLKGYDVVFGKFTALSLGAIYGLLSLLPMLAISLLLGGVTMEEFWRLVLALFCIQFFSLSAGIAVSAGSRMQSRAVIGTVLLIAVITALPWLGGNLWSRISPLHAFVAGFDSAYISDPAGYWWSLLCAQLFSWFFLLWASAIAPRKWHDSPSPKPTALETRFQDVVHRWQFGNARRRELARLAMLEENPVFWLAGRNLARQRVLWLVGGIGVTVAALFLLTSRANLLPAFLNSLQPVSVLLSVGVFSQAWLLLIWGVNFVLKIRLASHACHCLAEARRNQAVEMLLTSPLTVNEIIHGQILALRDTFVLPLIAIITIEVVGGLSAGLAMSGSHHSIGLSLQVRGVGVVYFLLFLLDALAVTWTGMWFGLSCKKESEAAVKTIFFVLVLPLVLLFFWPVGPVLMFIIPLFWIVWSRSRLLKVFRAVAVTRHEMSLRNAKNNRPRA